MVKTKYYFLILLLITPNKDKLLSMQHINFCNTTCICSDNVDNLVIKALKNIVDNGEHIQDNLKPCQQVYEIDYVLSNPYQRVHTYRDSAQQYLCRELLAFFDGSLEVNKGLSQVSSVWKGIADEKDLIASNYGYYIFYQKLPHHDMSQYEWVIHHLSSNLYSGKALINISSIQKNRHQRLVLYVRIAIFCQKK